MIRLALLKPARRDPSEHPQGGADEEHGPLRPRRAAAGDGDDRDDCSGDEPFERVDGRVAVDGADEGARRAALQELLEQARAA